MTDNEILKALEVCATTIDFNECPQCTVMPYNISAKDIIDLITRQRAEIERFEKENHENFNKWEILANRTKQRYAELYEEAKSIVKAEAIKEFAERVKANSDFCYLGNVDRLAYRIVAKDFDNLVQEMVGE